MKLKALLSLLPLMLLSLSVSAESLRIGMPAPGQVPFLWQDESGVYRGIYADTLQQIAQQLNIELEYIPLSQARLVAHFLQGEVDVEAGVSPLEQDSPGLEAVSLYSQPYGLVNEVIIYRPEFSFPAFVLSDLKGLRVATVRGAGVPDYIAREDFASQIQVARRVSRGWNDVGLMKEAAALHYQRSLTLDYQISLPYASNPVVFRLHRSKAPLLEEINRVIAQLKRDGTLDEIICNYLCGTQ
ncbi:substrate-binding periplasmic protein [Marinobacterium jannaschii]|uniref:substrate-binding periplasmic protein n=1 Tax=Marinobacterium jannaschii TaxID=64970 RepID=UPI000ACDDDF9|nr:transporter substrate-binding domain-containing protein [Marinobacterium jannaschii]